MMSFRNKHPAYFQASEVLDLALPHFRLMAVLAAGQPEEARKFDKWADMLQQHKRNYSHVLDFQSGLAAFMDGGAPTHNPFILQREAFHDRAASWQNGFLAGKTVDLGGRERLWMQAQIRKLQGQLLDAIDAAGVVPASCEDDYPMLDMMRETIRELAVEPQA